MFTISRNLYPILSPMKPVECYIFVTGTTYSYTMFMVSCHMLLGVTSSISPVMGVEMKVKKGMIP